MTKFYYNFTDKDFTLSILFHLFFFFFTRHTQFLRALLHDIAWGCNINLYSSESSMTSDFCLLLLHLLVILILYKKSTKNIFTHKLQWVFTSFPMVWEMLDTQTLSWNHSLSEQLQNIQHFSGKRTCLVPLSVSIYHSKDFSLVNVILSC